MLTGYFHLFDSNLTDDDIRLSVIKNLKGSTPHNFILFSTIVILNKIDG